MRTLRVTGSPSTPTFPRSGTSARPQQGAHWQKHQGHRQAYNGDLSPEPRLNTESDYGEVAAVLREWDRAGGGSSVSVLTEEEEPSSEPTSSSPAQTAADKPEQERQREVALALRQAEAAMQSAESRLDDIPNLPSARLKRELPQWLRSTLGVARTSALLVAAVLCHAYGPALQIGSAIFVGSALGFSGYRKGSLSASGALAAVLVGATTLGASLRAGATLLAFYLSSSKLTRLKEEAKQTDDDFKHGGQRNWVQVFCNGFIPAVLAALCAYVGGLSDWPLGAQQGRLYTAAAGAFFGYYACCCGDTWASELGQLSETEPRLVTSLRPVRKGTNGGVTPLGLAASLAGGLFIGAVFYTAGLLTAAMRGSDALYGVALRQWRLVPLGMLLGLLGSMVDSVLGATVQFTGFNRKTGLVTGKVGPDVVAISGSPLLTNNGVNLVSASVCAMLSAFLALRLF